MVHDVGVQTSRTPSLPFDTPDTDAPALVGAGFREVSLTKLCGEFARAFTAVGRVVVRGEVANRKTYGSTTFLTLRDRGIEIPVFVAAARVKFTKCANGDHVAVAGRIELQKGKAGLQLSAHEITPVGSGAIAAKMEETRLRLLDDGLIARPRRRLPLLPRRIGVVCGNDAAVRKDIESVLAHRFAGYPIVFQEVTVQGPGGVDGILWGLDALQSDPSIEVIILARGGGDASQLLPFSDESVCRAIAAARVPVVSAIGHEADRPLSDEVADLRCGTPSIAAGSVVPSRTELLTRVDAAHGSCHGVTRDLHARATARLGGVRWSDALTRRLEREAHRLDRLDLDAVLDRRIAVATHDLAMVDWQRPIGRRLERAGMDLEGKRLRIEALSPERVLERGYAVVRSNGAVIRHVETLSPGDEVNVTLAAGSFAAIVLASSHTTSLSPPPPGAEP